ncbi:cytochrome c [Noviherbaspirillum humi]|uniref:Cytochrome c n=1 Tax=Noviherbaspirillum humi TaxID=1688639 RepID=A0A239HZT2_9BURK|nr:cytochrome c family protein [Noviherbaspirillum humi]SNS86243.1 cytochrome c [Noviherbaspirillum humi]
MNRFILIWLAPMLATAMPSARAGGDPAAGKAVFARCASCHQVGPSARGAFGPQLNGIVGRPAAEAGDFKYSEAMRRSGIVWSEQTLAAFIRSPGNVVPGTAMRFFGLGSEGRIEDLIAYLKSFDADGNPAGAVPSGAARRP